MRRRGGFAAAVAVAIGGHLALAAVIAAQARLDPVQPHARTVWISAAAPAPQPAEAVAPRPEPRDDVPPRAIAHETVVAPELPRDAVDVSVGLVPPAVVDIAATQPRDAITAADLAIYLAPSELTRRALIASPVDLTYRPSGPVDHRGGTARLILLVSAAGTVDRVVVEESTLPEDFQAFAVGTFYKARFVPGRLGAQAVPARVVIEITDSVA